MVKTRKIIGAHEKRVCCNKCGTPLVSSGVIYFNSKCPNCGEYYRVLSSLRWIEYEYGDESIACDDVRMECAEAVNNSEKS